MSANLSRRHVVCNSMMSTDESFAAFVTARSGRLIAHAELLCGTREQARDIVQTVLTRACPRWRRIEHEDPYGYLCRAVTGAVTDWWRAAYRRRDREVAVPSGARQDARHAGRRRAGNLSEEPLMPTQDELRTAMNDLAAGTAPLPAAEILGRARRRRTRLRLATVAGAAAAVVAVTGVAVLGPFASTRQATVLPAAPDSPPATAGAGLTREQRFVFGPEQQSDEGIFSSAVTDLQTPPGVVRESPAEAYLDRLPGETELPAIGKDDDRRVRETTVDGTRVRIYESEAGAGLRLEFQWISRGTLYILTSEPAETADNVVYGPSGDDLRWIIGQLLKR